MSSLINSAMTGLNAAQAAISTTSNNISNQAVSGYSKQSVVLEQMQSTLNGNSYYGNGVEITGVHREYDEFITAQLRSASAQSSALTEQYNQVSNVDNLLASSSNSLSATLQDFFTNVQNVVSNAEDPSARQTLLGKADGLVNQFRVMDTYLRTMDTNINGAINTDVKQINTYSEEIASLNSQISRLKGASGGSEPNNLLDQRDALTNELNKLVGVKVSQQDGSYIVSMANGLSLVNGDESRQLVAMPSSADVSRTTVGYVDKTAGNVAIPETMITTGELGGTLAFRSQNLDTSRNQLNQLALNFADAFNTQHKEGYDSKGNKGTDFFTFGAPTVIGNGDNASSASLSASWSDTSKAEATDYDVSYDGSKWNVKRLANNTTVTASLDSTTNTLSFSGLNVAIEGTPANGDNFVVKPVANVIINMDVAVTNEANIAAAAEVDGISDNRNAAKLLELQNARLVNGNSTLSQAYASMVADLGNTTKTLSTTSTAEKNVVIQLTDRQKSVSGVSLDEEYVNLQQYQQYYLANAQVLQTASKMFDALMSIR